MSRFEIQKLFLLLLPVVCLFYLGLFLTIAIWYPNGLASDDLISHISNFTVVYLIWFCVFFSYRLFDWDSMRTTRSIIGRVIIAIFVCLVLAVLYFYFQPSLLITPRRFLLVHVLISGIGIIVWYAFIRRVSKSLFKLNVYHHPILTTDDKVESLVSDYSFLGLSFAGSTTEDMPKGSIVVIPAWTAIPESEVKELFLMRNNGIRFVEYHILYESLTRTVHLSGLTDLWFISAINYRKSYIYDLVKRIFDLISVIVAFPIFVLTFPFIAILIKLTSKGPILFRQNRVGELGKIFALYKYRTMTIDSSDNTWAHSGQTVTLIGRFLRATRLDELPQIINIFKGDMSIVGPRPEQVHIVQQIREIIPYYDERHAVKPGLTGWAQLHVYASSVEESRRKLQYDLYYIKHRSLLFDLEIIIKTVYNTITMAGR